MSAKRYHAKGEGAYGHYRAGCRCPECKTANAAHHQAWVDKVQSGPIPRRVHGTTNGYSAYGCRCRRCTAAQRLKIANYRDRLKRKGKQAR